MPSLPASQPPLYIGVLALEGRWVELNIGGKRLVKPTPLKRSTINAHEFER
jgi:hypothetical protein